ncbi:MBL fold metallo-hydrolase [Legionella sp.]|uniref:MBL fold metallo-hydrolase n=1 Tax=Legionella sp. TaxID=459 RepID=UPI00321FEAE9
MPNQNYYLRQNVVAEPLVNLWYAWSYIISPATAAMVFTQTHMKIMESYLKSPQMHQIACKNPENIGGPFIDYPEIRTEEIGQLFEQTKEKIGHHAMFADALKQLTTMLAEHPEGMSLEPLYVDLPEVLKGYVELYYDAANQPHFRFIEALLYHGKLATTSMQSMLLSTTDKDYRPFCLSTPRLPKDSEVHLTLPFSDPLYDRLFQARDLPLNDEELVELSQHLGLSTKQISHLFTTEQPANRYQAIDNESEVRVRYFGHACILIESKACNILVDPVISYEYPSDIERFTYADLPPKIDYVLLTHAHQDHVLLEHLFQLRHKITTVVVPANGAGMLQDPSLKLMLESVGFKSVISLGELEKINIPNGFIQGLPFLGEHGDLHIQTKIAHFINIENKKILCAADSNNLDPALYDHLQPIVGDLDLLFVGMECDGAPLSWLYQAILLKPLNRKMDQSRRLNGSDFVKAKYIVDTFNCKQVYVYALGQEPWLNYVMSVNYTVESAPIVQSEQLIEYCQTRNILAKRLFGKHSIGLNS